jgi:hypothetical protein
MSGRDNSHDEYQVGWVLNRDMLTITSKVDPGTSLTLQFQYGSWICNSPSGPGKWFSPALVGVFGVTPGSSWQEGKPGAEYLVGRAFALWDVFNYLANFSGVNLGGWDSDVEADLNEALAFKPGGAISHSLSVTDRPSLMDGGSYGQGLSPAVIGQWPATNAAAGTWSMDSDPANVIVVLDAGHSLKLRIYPTGLAVSDAAQLVALERKIGFGTRYPASDQIFPRKTLFFQG